MLPRSGFVQGTFGKVLPRLFLFGTPLDYLRSTAHFEGTMLSKTMIAMKTHASINGRLFAQTAVTLEMNTVVKPAL